MDVVKIRRVGNSDVVTVPRSWAARGYSHGVRVVIEEGPSGEMIVLPESALHACFRTAGRRAMQRHRGALDTLAAHDRGEAATSD
ncbi:MAG: hypothetical protein HYY04_06115 [Chloroflexi bacterium]|nr:hypothetical protein [Chloroflexota bacterium]